MGALSFAVYIYLLGVSVCLVDPKNKFVMLAYYYFCHYFYIKLYASIVNLFKQWHNNIHVAISTLC